MKEYIFNPDDFDMALIKNLEYEEFYFETTNFLVMQKACKEAKKFSRLIAIIGDPGFGKTNALQYFSKNNVNVYYFNVKESMSPKDLFSEILKIVGFDNMYRESTVYNLIQSIGYFLSSEHIAKSLLIIDEAGRLSNKNLMHFHDLRNSVNKYTGIMLAATLNFQEKLEKMNRGKIQGIPEFYSRINQWIILECPTIQEQAQYCMYRGIKNQNIINSIIKPSQDLRKLKSLVDMIAINILEEIDLTKNPQISDEN